MNTAKLMSASLELDPLVLMTELQARRKARSNLLDFTLYTYPNYRVNWHHRLLCQYLDRFVSGAIRRLIVAMPPRHGKSELVSVRLPAFVFGNSPDAQFVGASYGADLARRFNRDVQRVIDSPPYARLFPHTELFGSNVRTTAQGTWLRNSDVFEIVGHAGSYKGVGVGGGLTGFGFDYGSIDDPFKDAAEANSATIRQNKWEWYTDVFYTRQSPNAGILITMTRWNMDDTVGRLKESMEQKDGEQWELLELPAIMENLDTKHPEDPREYGEPLWANRFNLKFLEKARAQNSYSFAALYQQKPIPHGEAVFDVAKIDIIEQAPDCDDVVRFYDLAVTAKKHSDFTAGAKLGITKTEDIIIFHMYRAQKKMPDIERDIIQNAAIDGKPIRIRLEAEKAGIVQLDYLLERPEMRGYIIDKKAPEGDKYTRAQPFATRVNAGKVKMLRGAWNRALLDELSVFPMGAHNDQVDALSGAYDMLGTNIATVAYPDYD